MTKKNTTQERATELEYLTWFRCNAEFGPAEDDVIQIMNEQFRAETGKLLPVGWGDDKE